MKRSTYVPLLVIGSLVTLSGCNGFEEDLKQQVYRTREDCKHDWNDDNHCTPDTPGTANHSGGFGNGYRGPRYYWDRELGQPVVVNQTGQTQAVSNSHVMDAGSFKGETVHVGSFSRGGFGGTAHGFSMGG